MIDHVIVDTTKTLNELCEANDVDIERLERICERAYNLMMEEISKHDLNGRELFFGLGMIGSQLETFVRSSCEIQEIAEV